MDQTVAVRLRDAGSVAFFRYTNERPATGTYVIVEHDRGQDYGRVVVACPETKENAPKEPPKRLLRPATAADLRQIEEGRLKAKDAFGSCVRKIQEHKLQMKLVRAEYSFDRSKIVFYFTAEGRVDFRMLVKDLAKIFRARIELRQIGVRDEAKFFGGVGPCGRCLCCASFLRDFEPVTIKMAKEEGLPLNPPKISGVCGRLMCCLSYEYEVYKTLSRGMPREGERVHIPQGKGKVVSVNVFKRCATVELEDGSQVEVQYKEKEHGK